MKDFFLKTSKHLEKYILRRAKDAENHLTEDIPFHALALETTESAKLTNNYSCVRLSSVLSSVKKRKRDLRGRRKGKEEAEKE